MQLPTNEVQPQDQPFRFRLPFVQRPIGVGTAIQNVTDALHLKPCGGCQKRKDLLDRTVEFVPMGWT